MLEAIDKYKFGILAAFGTYIALFIYFQFASYDTFFVIKPYNETGEIVTEEEQIELKPENVSADDGYLQDVLNMANNVSDSREASYEKYYENQTPEQVAAEIKALEKEMEKDAGGSKDREKIQSMIDARKKKQEDLKNNPKDDHSPTEGGDVKTAKATMVSFDLGGRDAYQNNKWYVRNPGYKCDVTSRVTVVIDIKVDNAGSVVSAVLNSGKTSGASSCEVNTALKYAKMSKFEYKSGSGAQSGWISYIFMPKQN